MILSSREKIIGLSLDRVVRVAGVSLINELVRLASVVLLYMLSMFRAR